MTNQKKLHLICNDIPFPSDYGGVIDVFYKIKALHYLGIEIILHTFKYKRSEAPILENYCSKVFYYDRPIKFSQTLSTIPFIVKTRMNKELLANLTNDNHPIFFDSLHCTGFINHPNLKDRLKYVRMHNVEHLYYWHLFLNDRGFTRKIFFLIEALKLRLFQKKIIHANKVFAISPKEHQYFLEKRYNSLFVPPFHQSNAISSKLGVGNYILIQGNFQVNDNEKSTFRLLRSLKSESDIQIVVAGKKPSKRINKFAINSKNISIKENPTDNEMESIIQNAQIILLDTYQDSGIKLKLINSLYMGRHVICSEKMVNNTGYERLCYVANNKTDWIELINNLISKPFSQEDINLRTSTLNGISTNQINATKIANEIFKIQ